MFKRFILLTIAISTLLFANYANSEQSKIDEEPFPDLGPNIEVIRRIPDDEFKRMQRESLPYLGPNIEVIRRIPDDEYERLTNNHTQVQIEKNRFENTIIEWFVIGFVMTIIIAIMSILISLLWRFKFKISAYLFGIVTLLSVIAVPFIFYL
ncbi:hypothetical protein [Bartonella raoultii]|uniref:Uncharacterized protein n=1 Tax=Bartonella raoultii TaxID=1457020 RepID=A0ABS7IB96_9HYPH|nr:hypothetical protein [Bartonella raoultii]MBX4336381.1 hypothetical protein [Bartonella raoultii]